MTVERFAVRLDGAADSFLCRSDESVVEAYERAVGFVSPARLGSLPVGCRRGGCGVCRVQILDGAGRAAVMSRAHVSEADQAEGYALACRLSPTADLVLRVAPPASAMGSASVSSKKQTETV